MDPGQLALHNPADLDLHCFHNRILFRLNMVRVIAILRKVPTDHSVVQDHIGYSL